MECRQSPHLAVNCSGVQRTATVSAVQDTHGCTIDSIHRCTLHLHIDQREGKLIQRLKKLKVPFSIQNMPTGDMALVTTGGAYRLLLERKTWSDLSASVVDKRHSDQKRRLADASPRSR